MFDSLRYYLTVFRNPAVRIMIRNQIFNILTQSQTGFQLKIINLLGEGPCGSISFGRAG